MYIQYTFKAEFKESINIFISAANPISTEYYPIQSARKSLICTRICQYYGNNINILLEKTNPFRICYKRVCNN